MKSKKFREHFYTLLNKMKSGENFAFSRYSDGEMIVMQNKHLKLASDRTTVNGVHAGIGYNVTDHKEFDPNKHSSFRENLIKAYQHKQENYYVGLSCPCCVGMEQNEWMKKLRGGDDEHLTWANLLVNSNYPYFLNNMLPLLRDKDIYIVCNEKAELGDLPFSVKKDWRIGANAMINDVGLLEDISGFITENKTQDSIFLFAAASLSNLLIGHLFPLHKDNTYIDIGTTLNPYLKLPIARNYLKGYWKNSGNTEILKECVWN